MTKIIDTNLLLRYFLKDDPKKADAVEKLFRQKEGQLAIPDMVIAEMVWVLLSVYAQKRSQIAQAVNGLLSLRDIEMDHKVISATLEIFRTTNIKWIDAYLAALVQTGKYDGIYSYDRRDFDKISGVKRLEPR